MVEHINTLVVGGGQAGLAMSEHLTNNKVDHIILERDRIVEKWRTSRWDSLVANGPSWHDRFPTMEFSDVEPNAFAHKDSVVNYFENFAKKINAPVRSNVDVHEVIKLPNGDGFKITTSDGIFEAHNIVAATGPFQEPIFPPLVPNDIGIKQIHSQNYYNPEQLSDGAVLVVGAGSSGSQIAEEILRSGKEVYLSIGPHDRPPRRYRGRDNVWWLGVLGKWEAKTPVANMEHVTISVSGYDGGRTIDFRKFAQRGMNLLGLTKVFKNGYLYFDDDLKNNIANGDKNYLSLLDEADRYVEKNNLNFPEDPEARNFDSDPECIINPTLKLDLNKSNIRNIIWATGYKQNFEWLKVNAFDDSGKPSHIRGVSVEKGIYFLGLPWLSMRGSSFIWGVWKDAKYLAEHITKNK
jgi:putative flavoprotein involved in K+ transport